MGKFYPSHSLKPWNLLSQMQTLGPPVYLQFHHFDRMPAHIHWDPPLTFVKTQTTRIIFSIKLSYIYFIQFWWKLAYTITHETSVGGGDFLIHCKQKIHSFCTPLILLFSMVDMLFLLVVMVLFSQLWENIVSKSSLK